MSIEKTQILKDLFESDDDDELDERYELLKQLFSDENIETKTEITNTVSVSILETLSEFLEEKGMEKSASILKKFVKRYLICQLSYKRKSREEFVSSISSLFKTEQVVKNNNLSTIQQLNPIK